MRKRTGRSRGPPEGITDGGRTGRRRSAQQAEQWSPPCWIKRRWLGTRNGLRIDDQSVATPQSAVSRI